MLVSTHPNYFWFFVENFSHQITNFYQFLNFPANTWKKLLSTYQFESSRLTLEDAELTLQIPVFLGSDGNTIVTMRKS